MFISGSVSAIDSRNEFEGSPIDPAIKSKVNEIGGNPKYTETNYLVD